MAGGKPAAKRKKQPTADADLRPLQAWVATGLRCNDGSALARFVAEGYEGSSNSRLGLLGGLYLLIKKGGTQPTGDVLEQLRQLTGMALQEWEEARKAAPGQKQSIVLTWAAFKGLSLVAEASQAQEQHELREKLVADLHSLVQEASPQQWVEQWQPPVDYPAAAEDDAAAKGTQQQLAAHLGSELVHAYLNAKFQLKQGGDVLAQELWKALKAMAENKPEAKEEPKGKAKDAAKTKAAAAAAKEKDKEKEAKEKAAKAAAAKAALERQSPTPKQQPQQKRGKDTDKVKDALRGKAGNEKAVQELAEHKEVIKAAQQKAEEVLKYLSESTLGDKGPTPEKHMQELQKLVCVWDKDVKAAFEQLKNYNAQGKGKAADAKGQDSWTAKQVSTITQLLKSQFGPAQDEKMLLEQLTQVFEKGCWLVFSEPERPMYHKSLQEFQQHVRQSYLSGPAADSDIKDFGMSCPELGPSLLHAYDLDFTQMLQDDAARGLRASRKQGSDQANGFHPESNPWLEVFQEECPLRRYLFASGRTYSLLYDAELGGVHVLPELTFSSLTGKQKTCVATGFALLQLQRGQIVVGAEDLSTAPDWQIKAYQLLKVLLPMTTTAVQPEALDYTVFSYFSDTMGEAGQDLRQMLDPEQYMQAQAGSAGRASSSDGPSFSDGLQQDSMTILQMLHEAQALAEGGLPLALQVYACKVSGVPLPLPHNQKSAFRGEELAAALGKWDKEHQLELRCFLLQVLYSHFGRLAKYQQFLETVIDKRFKQRYVPLEMAGSSKEGRRLALAPEFYDQACMAAAVPPDQNSACCTKHTRLRELAEAEGAHFSRDMVDNADDFACVSEDVIPAEEREKQLKRYLLQAARVKQAQQDQELHMGTEKGLQALTKELFLASEYEERVPPQEVSAAMVPVRPGWETGRFYLLQASQLAIHREQLQAIITTHEDALSRHTYNGSDVRKAERALLQQRVAGMVYCHDAWSKWYERNLKQLREEMDRLGKAKSQAQEKAGKAAKDTALQDQERKQKMDQLHSDIEKAEGAINGMENVLRSLYKQAEMCAAATDAMVTSATQPDRGLTQTFELMLRDLINPRPAPDSMLEASLRKALQLSRMTLFEIDVTIMEYVNLAHNILLANMWRYRQPAAAVSVARHALTNRLMEKTTEQTLQALILVEEEEKAAAKPGASSKAAGKKKKKKGPAMQAKKVAAPTSDQEASDEEQEAAEPPPAAAADSEGEEQPQQEDEPDAAMLIDPRFLEGYQEDEQQDFEYAGGRNRSRGAAGPGAAAAQAAAAALGKPPAKAAAAAASQQQRPGQQQQQPPVKPLPQQQQQARPRKGTGPYESVNGIWHAKGPLGECAFTTRDGPVCWRCGEVGHTPTHCSTPQCEKCGKFGHGFEECVLACKRCGRRHHSDKCFVDCKQCNLRGHTPQNCPLTQCYKCGRYGHNHMGCPQCRNCWQDHEYSKELICCSKCRVVGHTQRDCKAKVCPTCGRCGTGCVVGNCLTPPEEVASAYSSSSRAAPPQQGAAPGPSSSRPPARAPAPLVQPQQVTLLPASQVPSDRRDALMNQLLTIEAVSEIGMQLLGDDGAEQLASLARVPADVVNKWLEQPNPQRFFREMLERLDRERARQQQPQQPQEPPPPQQQQREREQREGEQREREQRERAEKPVAKPSELCAAAAEAFEAAYPPGSMPPDWRSMTWRAVEDALVRRPLQGGELHVFVKAKKRALQVHGAAISAPGYQQPPPVRREGPRSSAGASYDDEGADGGFPEDESVAVPAAAPRSTELPRQQQHGAAAAPAAGAGPAASGMAAILHQKRQQQLQQQQQQQGPAAVQPGPGAQRPPLPAAPDAFYSMPRDPALQHHQQHAQPPVGYAPAPLGVADASQRIQSEQLQPWMVRYKQGAARAVMQLLPDCPEKDNLLEVVDSDPDSIQTDVSLLSEELVKIFAAVQQQGRHLGPWRELGLLVQSAVTHSEQQQQQPHLQLPPPAAAAPAAAGPPRLPPHMAHLPPHMAFAAMQQQQQHQPPPQQHYQQPPPQQQQQEDSDDDSIDMEAMLGTLGVDTSADGQAAAAGFEQPAAAPAGISAWADITGHDPVEEDTSAQDFPALGAPAAGDSDLERALAASRADTGVSSSSRSVLPGVSAAGLANQAGEYNCFLNVVVQCLWSCKAFTQQVREIQTYNLHPVVQALLKLFQQMEAAEVSWQPGHERAVINPTELRVALAEHTPFKCQEMNDANELLDTIYECFKESQHPGQCQGSRGILIDGVFGLLLDEKVACHVCSKETHKVPEHYEHLIVVNSAGLSLTAALSGRANMAQLLSELFNQETKFCDKDEGGCGAPNPRHRTLISSPQVLTLQLVWDQQVSGTQITELLRHVEESLDINPMYDERHVDDTTYQLTSAVAYYGQHYMAFVFNPKLKTWLMFDDASVSSVGTWQDVITKCGAGRIQPGVLFYRLVDLAEVADTAHPATAQHEPHHAAHRVSTSSSTGPGGPYGAAHSGHHAGPHAANPAHGYGAIPAPAAAAAPPAHAPAPAASASGLPASAGWGRSRPAAAQQPPTDPAAAGGPSGNTWSGAIAAAAGLDAADLAAVGGQGSPHYSGDTWPAPGSASQASDSSAAGAWGAGPANSSSSFSSSATGPAGRVSGGGEYGGSSTSSRPQGANLAAAALRGLGAPGKPRTAVSTGPGAALERGSSGSSGPPTQQPGGYVSGPGARGPPGDFPGGRGRAGVAGRGQMDSAGGWGGRGPGGGRGRGR